MHSTHMCEAQSLSFDYIEHLDCYAAATTQSYDCNGSLAAVSTAAYTNINNNATATTNNSALVSSAMAMSTWVRMVD
jgi:hypothetical protein